MDESKVSRRPERSRSPLYGDKLYHVRIVVGGTLPSGIAQAIAVDIATGCVRPTAVATAASRGISSANCSTVND